MADIFNMADTWNDGAATFTAVKMNVTDTASASASLLMDLQVGGASRLSVRKDGFVQVVARSASGAVSIGSSNGTGLAINAGWLGLSYGQTGGLRLNPDSLWLNPNHWLGWAAENTHDATVSDLRLYRDAANILAQRNGTNAQTFRLYNTFTDASNYERLSIDWAANVIAIRPQAAGTGTVRVLHISGLPTANPGPGILWNNAGTPAIGT